MEVLKVLPGWEAVAAWVHPQAEDIATEPVAEGALPGLANLGSTCFANSVFQCLLNTPGWLPEACLAFSTFEESSQSKKAALGRAFQALAREYGSRAGGALQRSNASLKNMKVAIAAIDPQYAGCQQQDAYEFLGCLLEGLEEGFGALLRGAGEAPSLSAGVIRAICGVATLTRRECHGCSRCFEVDRVTDTVLRLPLLSPAAQFDPHLREQEEAAPTSLQELLDASQKPETIEGYDCDACRARSAAGGTEHVHTRMTQHGHVIAETRDVVAVVLYRFAHALDGAGNFKPVKVKRHVACPTELNIESKAYRLFGVVSHLGTSLSAGHYVAAVRSRRDGAWYECNDETVTSLRLNALYDGRAVTFVRPGAEPYILFYHRDQGDNDMQPPSDAVQREMVAEAMAKAACLEADRALASPAAADDAQAGRGAAGLAPGLLQEAAPAPPNPHGAEPPGAEGPRGERPPPDEAARDEAMEDALAGAPDGGAVGASADGGPDAGGAGDADGLGAEADGAEADGAEADGAVVGRTSRGCDVGGPTQCAEASAGAAARGDTLADAHARASGGAAALASSSGTPGAIEEAAGERMDVDREGEWALAAETQSNDAQSKPLREFGTAVVRAHLSDADECAAEPPSVRRRLTGPEYTSGADKAAPNPSNCPLYERALRHGCNLLTSVGSMADRTPSASSGTAACCVEWALSFLCRSKFNEY